MLKALNWKVIIYKELDEKPLFLRKTKKIFSFELRGNQFCAQIRVLKPTQFFYWQSLQDLIRFTFTFLFFIFEVKSTGKMSSRCYLRDLHHPFHLNIKIKVNPNKSQLQSLFFVLPKSLVSLEQPCQKLNFDPLEVFGQARRPHFDLDQL